MRKTITVFLLAISSIFYAPQIFGQDTSKVKTSNHDTDDEDDAPQAPVHKKKEVVKGQDAPVSGGFLVGWNEASLVIGSNKSPAVNGVVIGGILDFHLVGVLHLETGLLYAMTGGSGIILVGGEIATLNINTVEIPVTFELKFGKPGRNHFCIGLGGYAAYNVSGSISPGDVNGGTLKIGSGYGDQIEAFDAGISLNIAYQLKNGLFFRIRGQGGLSNLQPNAGYDAINTESGSLEIGYLFGEKTKHTKRRNANDDVEMKM